MVFVVWIVGILLFIVTYYSLSVNGGLSDLLERKRKQREKADLIHKYPEYVLPKQDMKNDYGLDEYNRIVANALGIASHNVDDDNIYGVDVSYPIHQPQVTSSKTSDGELPNRQEFYEKQIEGCRKYYSTRQYRCDDNEYSRIAMNIQQPRTMQVRYYQSRFTTPNVYSVVTHKTQFLILFLSIKKKIIFLIFFNLKYIHTIANFTLNGIKWMKELYSVGICQNESTRTYISSIKAILGC